MNEQIRVLNEDPNEKGGKENNELTNDIDESNSGIKNVYTVSDDVKNVLNKNDAVKEAVGTDVTDNVAVKEKLGIDGDGNTDQGIIDGVQGENQSKTYANAAKSLDDPINN
ncbi:hypothetical protein Tco_0124604, partial [Tanacetum coccineum]